jgi:hypothetical protein
VRHRHLPRVSRGEVPPPPTVAVAPRAALEFPGLDLAAVLSQAAVPQALLAFPGAAIDATLSMVGQPRADMAFPGLDMTAAGLSSGFAFLGLTLDAQVRLPDPNAALVFPGLDITASTQAVATYANGYTARRRLAAAVQGDLPDETLTNLVLTIRHQASSVLDLTVLKAKSAGGVVESDSGWDIRLEVGPDNADGSGGTKVAHKLVGYTAAAGPAAIKVRVPSWRIARDNLVLFVYYGKAGLAASEEGSPQSGALAVTGWPDGGDRSGNGRDCTVSGVVAATVNGLPGVTMAAASYAERVGPVFFNGQQVLTQVARIKPSAAGVAADGSVVRIGGTASHTADFTLWHGAGASSSGTTNAYSQGASFGSHNPTSDGPNDSCDTTYSIIASLLDGKTPAYPVVYKNLELLDTTDFGTLDPANGQLAVASTDVLRIGAGPPAATQNTAVLGDYGEVEWWPFLWTEGRVLVSARTELFPLQVFALGLEDRRTINPQSPVAVPTYLNFPDANAIDVDLAAAAIDGETPRTVLLTAVAAAGEQGKCTATLVGGKARVVPASGASGTDRLPYTAAKGARSQQGRARFTFAGTAPPTGKFFADPNLTKADGSPKTAVVVTAAGQYATKLASVDPATQYLEIDQGVTIANPPTLTKSGTKAHPLVIMSRAPSGRGNFAGRGRINGGLKITGDWVWLYQLRLTHLPTAADGWCVNLKGDDCFVTRCEVEGSQGVMGDATDGTASGQRGRVGFNRLTGETADAISQALVFFHCLRNDDNNPHAWHIYYNWMTQDTNQEPTGGEDQAYIYAGQGVRAPENGDRTTPLPVMLNDTVAEYNFINCYQSRRFGFYLKHGITCRFNHLMRVGSPTSETPVNAQLDGQGHTGAGGHGIAYRGGNNDGCTCSFNRIEGFHHLYVQCWNIECHGNVLTHNTQFKLYPNEVYHHPPTITHKAIMGALGGHFAGNTGRMVVGFLRDDAGYTLGRKLGKSDTNPTVRIEKHTGDFIDDNGNTVDFDARTGQVTGSHPNIINAEIIKSDTTSVDLSPGPAPVLSSTICGPVSTRGITWDGIG